MTLGKQSFLVTSTEVDEIKASIFGKFCKNACGGKGALLKNGVFSNCICVDEFIKQIRLRQSGIPKKYWDFDLRNLTKDYKEKNRIPLNIIESYCDKIKIMVERGIGLYIQGTYGIAKSAMSFYILKEAIKQNIVCYSINMSQLTKMFYDYKDEENKERIEWIKDQVQLLLIEEIEKDYNVEQSNTFAGSMVNDFFRVIYDNKKALILTSNLTKTKLRDDKIHAGNVVDRFEELVDIVLVGTSFRKQDENLKQIMGQ